MSLTTYTLLDLRRVLTDRAGLFFSVALPVLFYLIFGAIQDYSDTPIGDGNTAAYVMIGMAVYGGVTAAAGSAGSTVVEQSTGWGRQLALTPLSPGRFLLSKTVVILVRSVLPVLAVNLAGLFTPAQMPAGQWIGTAALSVLVSLPFGFYGILFGQLFRSESAVSISSTALVILSFLGNVFSPLPQSLLEVGRFTPLYGPAALARYPLSDGIQGISDAPYSVTDPLWYAIINSVVWAAVFAVICAALLKREKGRG
ncbi:ABC transporter permease [Rothia sp. BD8]|uniref:ABC transporter permease n=1 Tax=Rothia sp. BD8 TaxID=2953894 RepID=UPI003841CCEB